MSKNPRPITCIVGGSEQHLGDLLADGRITDDDADHVRRFGEFLRAWRKGPLTPEQAQEMLDFLLTGDNAEWLGLDVAGRNTAATKLCAVIERAL